MADATLHGLASGRVGSRCTSYTAWPYECLPQVTPKTLLTSIEIQKDIAQASMDKRLSLSQCCHATRKKRTKQKKRSCFTLQNRLSDSSSPLCSGPRKRKKKHKTKRADPYYIRDIDDIDTLVVAFMPERTTPEKPQVSSANGRTDDRGTASTIASEPKSKSKISQTTATESQAGPTEEGIRAGEFTVYVRQLNSTVVGVALHPCDTLAELRRKIKCSADKIKFYFCGKRLDEKVPLKDQGVLNDSNVELHVGLAGGSDRDPEGKTAVEHKDLSDNMEEWSESDVEMWLRNCVKLKEEYILKIKDEEMNGHNVKNTFTLKFLQSTFQMKSGPAMKVLAKRDAFASRTAEPDEGNTDQMTVEEVCVWMRGTAKIKEEYVLKFQQEEFDGWNLKHSLDEEYLKHTIGMKAGPIQCLVDKAKELQGQEKPAKTKSDSLLHEETQGLVTTTLLPKHQSSSKPPASSQMKEYQDMLKTCLYLETKEDDPNLSTSQKATLDLIYSRWGNDQNEMDKHFCFLLLTSRTLDLDKQQLKSHYSNIWRAIGKHLQKWVSLLSPDQQSKYEPVEGSDDVMWLKRTNREKKVQLSQKSPKCGPINRRPANEIQNHTKVVLLVDTAMLTPSKTRYNMYLDDRMSRVLTFDFSKDHYWVASFDPNDLSVPFAFNTSELSPESFQHLTMSGSDEVAVTEDKESEKTYSAPPTEPMQCSPRPFGQYGQYSYRTGTILSEIETGVTNLLHPVHEFKFSCKENDELVEYFVRETMRFSCACLNVRSNGTIHFGIADDKTGEYHHGEVVGLSVGENQRAKFEGKLTEFREKCFQDKTQKEAAKACISPPVFAKVSGIRESRYVIEVDVTPKASVCGGLAFKMRMPRCRVKGKKQAYEEAVYFERVGSSSCVVQPEDLADETFRKRVKRASIERETKEKEAQADLDRSAQSLLNLADKLTALFCHYRPQNMSSFYHILVTNKPPSYLIDEGQLNFISCIDWVAVFDFDPDSFLTGLAKMYKEKGMSEYFPQKFSNYSSDIENFCDEIKFRQLPLWLSCNGRHDQADIGEIVGPSGEALEMRSYGVKEWYKKRRKGVKDAISFLSKEEVIPDASKAVVTFLLFSDDYEIIADTFRNFADEFKIDRLLYVAESEDMLHGWNTRLEEVYAEDEHRSRGVVGMPWNHVNETIKQFSGVTKDEDGLLPTSTGAGIMLKERNRKLWKYLDVVCKNQCENSEMSKNKEALERHRQEKEEEFWKGKKVDWWNFWFTDSHISVNRQVLTRDNHEELKSKVRNNLTGNIGGGWRAVNIVHLFHHPGAGGSTMARHVLWDLRKEYRCAVVKSPTLESCKQILDLYLYEEPKSQTCRPVLVLVEDIDVEELHRFKSEIDRVINRRLEEVGKATPVCVLLHCMRSTSALHLKLQNTTASVVLEQRLSKREIAWCNQELDKSRESCPERDPLQLLSFMIFKANFDSTYVEDTVREILESVDLAKSEKSILKFVSLLNKFVKDSVIPVARCKALLGIKPLNPHAERIEDLLSQSSQLLLVESMREETIGTVHVYCAVHPLVAEQILNQLLAQDNQTYGEVALDLINSKLFMDYKFARGYMVTITGQMLKKRQRKADNTADEMFSPLILHICEEENDVNKALEVMTTAYERLGDGILAQQAARLFCIKAKDFDKARRYARQGADDTRSCYTLDTVGQVEKEEFIHRYKSHIAHQEELSPEGAREPINLAFRAMSRFQDAQNANRSEGTRSSVGFVGEVQVCFLLLNLIQCIPMFKGAKGRKCLCDYLTGDEPPPSPIQDCWAEYHDQFRQLRVRVDSALKHIANINTYYKHDVYANVQDDTDGNAFLRSSMADADKTRKFLVGKYEEYAYYFCISPEDSLYGVKDEGVKCELRRRQIEAKRGNNFFNIFDHVRRKDIGTLRQIRDLLKANVTTPIHKKPSDIQSYILVNLALAAIDKTMGGVPSLNTLCEHTEMLIDMCDTKTPKEAYPYFLLYIFMWPLPLEVKQRQVAYHNCKFYDALDQLKIIHRKIGRSPKQQKPYQRVKATEEGPRAATMFFLGKKLGTVQQYVHVSQLPPFRKHEVPTSRGLQSSVGREQFWNNPAIPKTLYRLTGTQYEGTILVKNVRYSGKGAGNIEVRPACPIRTGSRMEKVSFYLGFSWAGPVAYDVQTALDNSDGASASEGAIPDVRGTEYTEDIIPEEPTHYDYLRHQEEMEKLNGTLKDISNLKKERDDGGTLTTAQLKTVASEAEVLKRMKDLVQQRTKQVEDEREDI